MDDLISAIEASDINKLAILITANPSLVHTQLDTEWADQPLHVAASQDLPEIVSLLLDRGANVNARGCSGKTPLHLAAFNGALHAAEVLIQRGADINALDTMGWTPLYTATCARDSSGNDIVQLLLDQGANVDLNTAVVLGDVQRVVAMLNADPEAVQKAPFPASLIHDAIDSIMEALAREYHPQQSPDHVLQIVNHYLPMLEQLVAHGAGINSLGSAPWPPLFRAVQMPCPTIAQFLLDQGADVHYRAPDGTTAWDLAENAASPAEIREVLCAYGYRHDCNY